MSGYLSAHRQIYKTRGKASEHPCKDCGVPAQDWALQPGVTPLEENGRTYSDDPRDYVPMCRRCHAKQDGVGQALQDPEVRRLGRVAAWEKAKNDPDTRVKLAEKGRLGGLKSKPVWRRCGGCSKVMPAGSLGNHQKASGHTGWTGQEQS